MTHNEFNNLLGSIDALSPDQVRRLIHELETRMVTDGRPTNESAPTDAESDGQAVQRRLYEAGVVSEIKPPIRDLSPYRDRVPVPIKGEALSETVIRERR